MAQEQAQGGGGNSLSEVFMAIFVLLLIILLLCELPNWVVNICICLNITLGIVLMMISLYVKKTLELASFPSIILIGTMFRLVLSIASTRLILSKGEAGEVILPCVPMIARLVGVCLTFLNRNDFVKIS